MPDPVVTNNTPVAPVAPVTPAAAPEQTETFVIPDKFKGKTTEEVIKSYMELEKTKSKPKTLVDPIPDAPVAPVMSDVDFDAIGEEFAEKGELSDDSYQKSVDWIKKTNPKMTDEKAKKVLDQHMAGLKAQQAIQQQEVDKMLNETIGGRDNYTTMVQWASANLTPEEIEAYDNAIASNINSAKLAIEGLHAKYTKANGNPPAKLLSGDGSTATTQIMNFDTWEDYKKARLNPKYKSDPSYKKSVDDGLVRSNLS